MNVAIETSGKELLRCELENRCRKNPRYSLRSFAKSLGLGHSILSLVLSGKRELSEQSAKRVASQLGLDPVRYQAFVSAAKLKNRRAPPASPADRAPDEHYQRLSLESFAVISEWHYYAILSLLDLPESRFDARWIAGRLGIGEAHAKIAMDRLSRLGLVARDKRGKWKQTGNPIKIENTVSTAATRSFYKGLLEKAAASIDEIAIEDRDLSSMTLAMSASELPYVRERIKRFRRELTRDVESRNTPDSVFELMIQFFPLTKPTEKK